MSDRFYVLCSYFVFHVSETFFTGNEYLVGWLKQFVGKRKVLKHVHELALMYKNKEKNLR